MRSLRVQIRSHQPDIVFLEETLLADVKINGVVNSLNFSLFLHVPPLKKWEGLLCMWHPGLDMEPVYTSTNVMAFMVYSNPVHIPWLLIFVYCLAEHNQKNDFL